MRLLLLFFFLCFAFSIFGQNRQHLNVLFIGNSYTEVNNLPGMIADLAMSTGDTLSHDRNTPGGCTFYQHTTNQSATKIAIGGWNYVVLQEQSQLPSFPNDQVASECFPYATMLANRVREYNTNCLPVFYMTWGRKNGDADNCPYFPPLCTYQGMDSLLYERYMMMANDNNAVVSPVGYVWHFIRTHYSGIELYSADESHPSPTGTYAAACTFYTVLFRNDPTLITDNKNIDANTAQIIRNIVKTLVYDSLSKWNVTPHIYADILTDSANQINQTSAVVYGTIYCKNIGIKESGFEYKLLNESDYTKTITSTILLIDTLFHLNPNQEYIFRAFCQLNNDSVIYGEEKHFHTLTIPVSTDSISQINDTNATAYASFLYDGDTLLISTGFEYIQFNLSDKQYKAAVRNQFSEFSAQLNALIPETNYQIRAYLTYKNDTLFGQTKSFTTQAKKADTTQIISISSLEQISVSPNPVNDIIQLNFSINDFYIVQLYDIYGHLLKTATANGNNLSINCSSYATGIYYILIRDKNLKQRTIKIIKND